MAVAIESPRGALVDTLIELGLAVFAINLKQLDRFRDRHTVAGAKDDRRDALVLADSLRTDRPAFHRVQVDHPLIIQIRALSRAEDDLQVDLGRLTNRAREQVYRLAPGLLTLCPAANESWFWTLLELMMSPSRLTRHRIEKLLHHHRIRRLTADEVFAQAPISTRPSAVCTNRCGTSINPAPLASRLQADPPAATGLLASRLPP